MNAAPEKLRVAMLATVSWPAPPESYGPWEQVASNIAEGLVTRGHDVTLFAAQGSKTAGRLVETVPHPFELWPKEEMETAEEFDPATGLLVGPPHLRVLEQQHIAICMEAAHAGEFDIVHSHLHVHALVFSRLIPCPMVSTLHGSAWARCHHPVLNQYHDMPYVSISDAERVFHPELNYVATVYNGIQTDRYRFNDEKEDFLLFSGRLAPEKGASEAVQIALAAGVPIKLAGMIEPRYQDYYSHSIEPHVDGKNVEYVGLLKQTEIAELYQRAKALVCPIHWDEPFGLVAVEAQACGTPMLGARKGAFKEIVEEGVTGFLFDEVDEAARLVPRLDEIDPHDCRKSAVERFSADAMVEGYEKVYRKLIAE